MCRTTTALLFCLSAEPAVLTARMTWDDAAKWLKMVDEVADQPSRTGGKIMPATP